MKFCKKCNADTEWYSNNRCKPCRRKYESERNARPDVKKRRCEYSREYNRKYYACPENKLRKKLREFERYSEGAA